MLGGLDLISVSKRKLRKSINVVLQNPYINENESIRNNLLGVSAFDEPGSLSTSQL